MEDMKKADSSSELFTEYMYRYKMAGRIFLTYGDSRITYEQADHQFDKCVTYIPGKLINNYSMVNISFLCRLLDEKSIYDIYQEKNKLI